MSLSHRLLQRQIRKHLGGVFAPELEPFLQAVNDAYTGLDEDKTLVERTLDLSSQELVQASQAIQQKQAELTIALEQVMDSLRYASRLQKAQLPQPERFERRFSDFSVVWLPRDTIGGDLWWISPGDQEGRFSIALVDCTGHGVPGAMLSLLASTSLEQIYGYSKEPSPDVALEKLDHAMRRGLNQNKLGAEGNDGCDAAILQIDVQNNTAYFSGCRIDLFCVDPGEGVVRIGSNRFSLGYSDPMPYGPVLHEVSMDPQRMFVMSTDGLVDQVGVRPEGGLRSFGFSRLMRCLSQSAPQGCVATTNALMSSLEEWRGMQERRDDLSILAFKVQNPKGVHPLTSAPTA